MLTGLAVDNDNIRIVLAVLALAMILAAVICWRQQGKPRRRLR